MTYEIYEWMSEWIYFTLKPFEKKLIVNEKNIFPQFLYKLFVFGCCDTETTKIRFSWFFAIAWNMKMAMMMAHVILFPVDVLITFSFLVYDVGVANDFFSCKFLLEFKS